MTPFESPIFAAFIFFLGLSIGSFLNVVIYRLPRGESIVFPASHCPSCLAPIQHRYNIPLFGYLMLRGRCRNCRERISAFYPVVESITGVLFLALFLLRGPSLRFVADAALGSMLIAITIIDLRHMMIPNRLVFPGGIIGAILAIMHGTEGIFRASAGAAAGILLLGTMALIGALLFRRESLGIGDIKLAAVTGLFLGPLGNLLALILAILIGGVWGIIHLTLRKGRGDEEIPFGPFIAAGCCLVMFLDDPLLRLITAYLQVL